MKTKKTLLGIAAVAGLAAAGMTLPTAASAQDWGGGGHRWHHRDWDDGGYRHGPRGYWHHGRYGYWREGAWVNLGYPGYYYSEPVAYYPPQPVAYYPAPYYGPALGLSFHIH